jgi:hypothetical protein
MPSGNWAVIKIKKIVIYVFQEKGRILFINAPNDALVSQLPADIDASVWTWNHADYQMVPCPD